MWKYLEYMSANTLRFEFIRGGLLMVPGTREEHHKDARTSRWCFIRWITNAQALHEGRVFVPRINVIVSTLALEMNIFGKSSARCVR